MVFDLIDTLDLAVRCAPAVAPATMLSIVQVESGFNPLAIHVNGPHATLPLPASPQAAAAQAEELIAAGQSVDLGLAQINSRNLTGLGLSVAEAFEPCRNLAASAQLLSANYRRSLAAVTDPQTALRTALSLYNTGHEQRGFANGYVAKVTAAAARVVPALTTATVTEPSSGAPTPAPRPSWDVFGQSRSGGDLLVRFSSTPLGANP